MKLLLIALFPLMYLLVGSLRKSHNARHLYWSDFKTFDKTYMLESTVAIFFAVLGYCALTFYVINLIVLEV